MKKIIYTISAAGLLACSQMNELEPQGGIILSEQLQMTNATIPSRADASFNGMFTKLGAPGGTLGSTRPDDFGFIMIAFSSDIEAADVVLANSGYNWFSACGLLTSYTSIHAISACSAGDPGSIPGLGRSLGEGVGYPLQYSCLENSMDRGSLIGYSP